MPQGHELKRTFTAFNSREWGLEGVWSGVWVGVGVATMALGVVLGQVSFFLLK